MRSQVKVLLRQIGRLEDEAEIARRLADFGAAERSQLYRFIASQADRFPISVLCKVCGVSRSSYYSWLSTKAGPKESELEEAYLANQIYDIWKKSRGRYGAPRITAELWRARVQVRAKKVARIMAEIAIAGRSGRRKVKTTTRDHSQPVEADLVKRDFTASRPDELYVTDITYIPTDEGFLYLAAILDVHTRAVLGWSMATHLRTELCLDALDAVASCRGKRHFPGTVLHSDHGCQYTANLFKKRCKDMGITQSMGTVGDSYDNAMAESLWASLKREAIDLEHFTTIHEARRAIFEWLVWYNNERLHSSLGYLPPMEFERLCSKKLSA